ncbi:T9SS type A sorting domain-containing protein [Flavobacterium sp. N1994]|uniref:Ig-like domain-containing protein n=1 Tax=Flavobacterium sp. N1994 TaxID=2986827 RepID=UPI0022229CF5|nr:T9SS type A sorting domain-containing protein [Flavobacterium sp. N1994]
MKTTKYKIVVFLTFLLAHISIYAQYSGGNSDGFSSETLSNTSCPNPAQFYAYFGGSNDGSSVDTMMNTICGTPASFYAYIGGSGDTSATDAFNPAACGTPPSFFAYFGGSNDGSALETISNTTCGFPPQFYAYFGGQGDGYSLDKTAPICPTLPPFANFTASATSICVGQSVTFTDTSTNIPGAWTWTLPGGTPNSSTVQNPTVVYNTVGTYTVTLQAANFNGLDTKAVTNMITVTAYPTVTTTTPASRCDTGTVTLGATASAGTLSWYAAATGGSALGTGTSFTTPSISTTTTYYVETANGSCNSARTAVVATVNTTPTITSTTPGSRCDAGSVTLNATSSAGNTIWYANATGGAALATTNNFGTPSISSTTTYYVEASTGSCISPRTPVIATVNTTPIVTATTPATRCDSGTVTLGAVANSGTLNWYSAASGGSSLGTGTSFTTPSLTGTTTYYVAASNATCTSVRTPVIATVNATPTVTGTAGSRCDSGTVVLSASASAGTISWFANASGGTALGTGTSFTTPSISSTTTFYAESVNGTCTSTRTAVVATINTTPSITSTTGATICGQGGGTLTAIASAGTVYWYSVATGGSAFYTGTSLPVSGGSYTFYAEASTGSCTSARVPVTYTYIPTPSITVAGSNSRCGAGSVTLTSAADSGTISWFTAATGGSAIATGTSFVTPSLASTTTYYVEAANGTCLSSARTAITATINVTAPPIANATQTFCNAETVGLIAVIPSGPSIIWHTAATGGTVIPNNTPIVSGTTYYASQTISGCESTVRTAVTMTTGACLGNDEFEMKALKVYPNPTIDLLNISYNDSISKVEVFNIIGQQVLSVENSTNEIQIDMSRFASGTYLIKVSAADLFKTVKVIKK